MIKIKISDLLGHHKMTQKDLAVETDIRQATVSGLYHETTKTISIEQIDAICRVLNCQVGDVFEYIPEPKGKKQKKN